MGREPLHRERRYHTRSRTGCLTCKKRRIRCDENRPSCSNCSFNSRQCAYAAPGDPINLYTTRPVVPGMVAPWQITPSAIQGKSDPFDALPVEMPFKSLELLHYFVRLEQAGSRKTPYYFALASCDPVACRSTVLVAGLHFLWSSGNFSNFEATYLYHKGESIATINRWLADSDDRATTRCMRLISTLCVTEACFGNVEAAESHLLGLITLLDIREAHLNPLERDEAEYELIQRYVTMAQCFVGMIRGRLRQSTIQKISLLDQWHNHDARGHENRLRAVKILPSIFNIPSTARPRLCDAGPIIASLQSMIAIFDQSNSYSEGSKALQRLWTSGSQASIWLSYSRAHLDSLPEESAIPESFQYSPDTFWSSWSSLAITGNFFLHAVLGLWSASDIKNPRLVIRSQKVLNRDLDSSQESINQGSRARDLWLWKAFTGASALTKACESTAFEHDKKSLQSMRHEAYRRVQTWSKMTGVTSWSVARQALERVVWAKTQPDAEPKAIWSNALAI